MASDMQLFLALVKEDKNESLAWMALMATTHTRIEEVAGQVLFFRECVYANKT